MKKKVLNSYVVKYTLDFNGKIDKVYNEVIAGKSIQEIVTYLNEEVKVDNIQSITEVEQIIFLVE